MDPSMFSDLMDYEVSKDRRDLGENQNRNSLSYDEVEHKLGNLIDAYKQSLKNVSKQDNYDVLSSQELPKTLLQNYDTSLYNANNFDHLTLPSSITKPLNPEYSSSLNNFISDYPSIFPQDIPPSSMMQFYTSVHSPTLISSRDAPFKYPYSDTTYISDIHPVVTDYTDYIPPIINDQLIYGTSVSVLPSQKPLNLQTDESVTFNKMLNTGISSQLSKQISFLLYELNRLKETNEKLDNELNSCKSELNSAKNKIIMMQTKSHIQPSSSDDKNLTGIVEEIYRAQKLRDMAMMDRLKEANQVKNFALALAQQRAVTEENDDIVSSLVRSQSLDDLRASTSKFLQAIVEEKDRKRATNEEEMEAILLERDLIYKQKRDLEQETKVLNEKLKSESGLKSDFQKRLFEVEKEKNQLFTDINFLQNKFKDLKACESLYKSLSKEEELHQQFSNKLSQLSTELENKNKQTRMQKLELDRLRSSLENATRDNKLLTSKCNSLEAQMKEGNDQIERLNRLVEVLRRKLKEGSLNMQF